MSDEIKDALSKHLYALDDAFPTAEENANFPLTEEPFWVPSFLFAEPDDVGFRDSPFIQRGIFTVTLAWPINVGSADAENKAKSIRAHFKRGTSVLTTAGFSVIIDRTPEITGGMIEEDRYIIRVRIRFYAHIPA